MKIASYILIGVTVTIGFGLFGFVVGESIQKFESVDIISNTMAQSNTNVIESTQHAIKIKN